MAERKDMEVEKEEKKEGKEISKGGVKEGK